MKIAIAMLKGIAPYSQSKYLMSKKPKGEQPDDFEKRVWPERLHLSAKHTVVIPPMALKKAITAAASFLGMQIQGKGKKTYSKHFQSGIMIVDAPDTEIRRENVETYGGMFDAQPGKAKLGSGGTRVWRCYPEISNWTAKAEFTILSDEISEEVFREHLEAAGMYIGIGRFRPENGGYYGRFVVEKLEWKEVK